MPNTPHINAKANAFAKTVLMPGDPKRSKFIADNFLENAILVNDVRGMQAYTGTYKGKKVSVMASGMGMPSMSIFAHELFSFFGVENIIRVGTCGALNNKFKLGSILVANCAITDSNIVQKLEINKKLNASNTLLDKIQTNKKVAFGTLYTSDVFYAPSKAYPKNADAVEMETAALYGIANKLGKNALAICTISDVIGQNEIMTAKEREQGLKSMIELALSIA